MDKNKNAEAISAGLRAGQALTRQTAPHGPPGISGAVRAQTPCDFKASAARLVVAFGLHAKGRGRRRR